MKTTLNLNHIIQRFDIKNGLEREQFRKELVNMGQTVIPHLLELLEHPKQILRWESMKALSEISHPTLIPTFIDKLESDEGDIRWMAAEGLINIGKEAVKPILDSLIEKSDSVFILSGAHHVFYELFVQKQLPENFPVQSLLPLLKKVGKEEMLKVEVFGVLSKLK